MKTRLMVAVFTGAALLGVMVTGASIASAQTTQVSGITQSAPRYQHDPVVYGKVTSVNGNLVTVRSARDNILYSVDISSARVTKLSYGSAPALITAQDVRVGDDFAAHGTISGTTITATQARDGLPQRGGGSSRGGNCQYAN